MITEGEIRSMYPWLPEPQLERLIAALVQRETLYVPTEEEKKEQERWARKHDPNRPKRKQYWHDFPRDELDPAYGDARREHAFLLRCESLKLREIGARLGISAGQARTLIDNESRRMKWRLRRNVRWTWTDAPSPD